MGQYRVRVYLRRLGELLLGTEVTNGTGAAVGLDEAGARAVEMILATKHAGKKIILIGNGGSDAVASHLQTDLANGVGVRALTVNDPGMLTALSNDQGYACVFQRPVQLWAERGDLLLAISSSGQSENILRAVNAARVCACRVITLSGFRNDNPLRRAGDLNFYVASDVYGFVEVAHAAVGHFLTDSAALGRRQEAEEGVGETWIASDTFS